RKNFPLGTTAHALARRFSLTPNFSWGNTSSQKQTLYRAKRGEPRRASSYHPREFTPRQTPTLIHLKSIQTAVRFYRGKLPATPNPIL
ncbi:MAG TPA: hypothetical protein VH413_02070, partial [Verrucomicrobiae bacterium]|nr:hypothetical protein [Verrucomicrobiae bacterium]